MFVDNSPLTILKKRYKFIIFSGLLIGTVALLVSLLFPLEYRADAQALIISKSRYGVDPYTVVKSAERVGENLVQVIGTSDFYNKVMLQAGYNIDRTKFDKLSERERRKLWQKTVKSSVVYGTGVVNVSAYDSNVNQAKQLAGATVDALAAKGWEYVGGDVTIKVVNQPVVTRFPVRPNIILNFAMGFVVGMVLSSLLVIKKK
ncbi:MAG TPA: hypothetical protein PK831_00160 [Candidatus Magasanikbacteria bacterium]|jgi:capsular polysaccharide biosynthesis protein|nr:hypothetical protein [Candidatus Magasanikbacteria bacterium]HQF56908.1 hypothetical protein [Candidatus Magasanikbacteria bacterium]HQL52808.1 hypothetical protein [Candidatus Magasanikbacteria bacterium]